MTFVLKNWDCAGGFAKAGGVIFKELNIYPWQKSSRREGKATRLRLVRSTGDTSPDFGAGEQSPCGLEMQGMTEKHLRLPKSPFHHLSAHFPKILTTFVPVHSLVELGVKTPSFQLLMGTHTFSQEQNQLVCVLGTQINVFMEG